MIIQQGYWRSSTESHKVQSCLYVSLCPGKDTCPRGHTGAYCRVCKKGYFRSIAQECIKCHDDTSSWLLLLGFIVASVVIAAFGMKIYLHCSKRTRKRMKALAKITFVCVL